MGNPDQKLGKLSLAVSLAELMESQQQINEVNILPVQLNHILALDELPTHHKDPFDRLLIAQARIEGMEIATADPVFSKYDIKVIWQ